MMDRKVWTHTDKCRNCGHEFTGKYCVNCGQAKATRRITVKTLYNDLSLSQDKNDYSYLGMFLNLVKRPGPFVREYLDGRRKNFISPKYYFIFILGGYVFLYHQVSDKLFPVTGDTDTRAMLDLVKENINYFSFILPITSAFAIKWIYSKATGINLGESVMVSMYFFGTSLVIGIIFVGLVYLGLNVWGLRLVFTSIYMVYALYSFGMVKGIGGIAMAVVSLVIGYALYMIVILSASFAYIKFIKVYFLK